MEPSKEDKNEDSEPEATDKPASMSEGGVEEEEDAVDEDNKHEVVAPVGKKVPEKKSKPGIVYLSRIPPLMRPNRIKQIFMEFGEIVRVFLQPEEDFFRKKRRKKGGSAAKKFTEGWVEFKRKKIAKKVALTLNNSQIAFKKRSQYYDELWSMKYLPGFKWAHLVERLEYERQVKQQRTRIEISQAKKETNIYLQNVDKSRKLQKIAAKRQKQGREWVHRENRYRQRRTRDEIMAAENSYQRSGKVTKDTLLKIFKQAENNS